MCQPWDNVRFGGFVAEPRNVNVACVCRFKRGSIWERDRNWVRVQLFVDDVGAVDNEVAGGAGVAECSSGVAAVLWRSLRGGVVFFVIVEGK